MREQLAAYFQSHQKLVESSALQLILATPQPLDLSRQLIEATPRDSPFVTREMVERLLTHRPAPSEGARAGPAPGAPPPGAPPFALVAEGFVPGGPGRQPLEAYGELFASRFRSLARLLRSRGELQGSRPIHELAKAEGRASVIGMVRDVRSTPEKHHVILSVEDDSGAVEVLVPRDSEAAKTPFLPDEVVGLLLQLPRERDRLPRVISAHRPDLPVQRSLQSLMKLHFFSF